MSDYTRYIALGDSMSIDLYPALDAGEVDVAVALERLPGVGNVAPIGAASLLYKNSEEHWPDDIGDDLSSLFPGIQYENLASDAATVGEVFGEQLPQIDGSDERVLITLTIGGNDLLSAFGNRPRRSLLERIGRDGRRVRFSRRHAARTVRERQAPPHDDLRSLGPHGKDPRRVR